MNEPAYHEGMRELQEKRETRALADRLEKVTMRSAFTDEDRLFIDFETPRRLRVNGTAVVSDSDPALRALPGAVFVVRVTAERIFPNCPRYIHKMQMVEESVHAPRPDYTPPVPAWKTFEVFRDALPPRDRTPPAGS
jgi:hypothetical protein